MTQEEDDAANELNHLGQAYDELEMEHGRLARKGGVTPEELIAVCNRILLNIGNAQRTGVADPDSIARKVLYWNNMRKKHLDDRVYIQNGFPSSASDTLRYLAGQSAESADTEEWRDEGHLYQEIRERMVRSLQARMFVVTDSVLDDNHTIRLDVETEKVAAESHVFACIMGVLVTYPSYEPKVVVNLTTVKIERSETKMKFTIGG